MTPSRAARRARLAVQPLEERAVPANDLTITSDPDSFNVRVTQSFTTVTINTTGSGARLSLATIREVMLRPDLERVIVSSAADAPQNDSQQAGHITWPAGVGAPDFSGVDPAILQFQAHDGPDAAGNIDLTGVAFDAPAGASIGLGFFAAGAVTFHDDGAAGVSFGPGIGEVRVGAVGPFTYEGNGGGSGARIAGAFVVSSGTGPTTLLPDAGIEAEGIYLSAQSVTLGGRFEARSEGLRVFGPVTLAADTELISERGSIGLDHSVDGDHHLTVRVGPLSGGSALPLGSAVLYGPVGAVTPLAGLTIAGGQGMAGSGVVRAGTVQVGTGAGGPLAAFRALGTLTGDVVVRSSGVFAPGNAQDHRGELTVVGDVTFDGGTYAPDLGPQPEQGNLAEDHLTVTGDVTLLGATLGGGYGVGQLPGPTRVLDFGGTLTGTFANAPVGAAVLVGTDAVTVTDYGPAGTGIVLAPVPVGPTPKRVTGVEADGTAYTAALTGPGQLVSGTDVFGRRFLVVRGARPLSVVTVTTRANASDAFVTFDAGVGVSGPLGTFRAPNVDVAHQFVADSSVRSIRVRDLVDTGGVGLRLPYWNTRTALAARHVSADVRVAGRLTALHLTGDLTGTALVSELGSARMRDLAETGWLGASFSLGSFAARTVAGTVAVRGPAGWPFGHGRLGSFRVADVAPTGRIEFDELVNAGTVGRLAGTLAGDLASELSVGEGAGGRVEVGVIGILRFTGPEADVDLDAGPVDAVVAAGTLRGEWKARGIGRLTAAAIDGLDLTSTYLGPVLVRGNLMFGLAGEVRSSTIRTTAARLFGIDSLTVTGNVIDTTISAANGDVGPVRVGRFLGSHLYVDYTPAGAFNTGGTFHHEPSRYRLASFTTTAVRAAAGGPWAFEDSEVAADSVGTVRLSGVKTANGGDAFGLKVRTSFGSVRVAAADDPAVPRNTDLSPRDAAVAGDFFFLDV